MQEIHVTDNSNRDLYTLIVEYFLENGWSMADEVHIHTLEFVFLDTLYFDVKKNDKVLTIHLEHYSGIYLYSENDDFTEDELRDIWKQAVEVNPHFMGGNTLNRV